MKPLRLLAAVSLLLTLGACSSDDSDDPGTDAATSSPTASESVSSATPTPSPDTPSPSTPQPPTPTPSQVAGPELVVTIKGDQVKPNSQEIDLEVGETLIIRFDTDRGGELHVHSTPEQFVEFEAGTSMKKLVIEAPGVVEVEEHDTSHVVASLEVR